MLITYYIVLLLVLCLIYVNNKNKTEHFKNPPIYYELIDNTEIDGSFTPKELVGYVNVKLGVLDVKFNISDKNISINNLHKFSFNYTIGTTYTYKIILFPLEGYVVLLINDNVVYSNYLNAVKISHNQLEVLVDKNHTITKLNVIKSSLDFLSIENVLYKINKNTYVIEKEHNYYFFRNIQNGLYLGIDKEEDVKTDNNKLVILFEKTKGRYVILSKSSKIMGSWKTGVHIEKLIASTWLNYGSVVNIMNSDKLYLTTNKLFKYITSGLSAVYCDSNNLTSWAIEELQNLM